MTSKYSWQKTEKDVAKDFGTERTPFSGSTSGLTRSDSLHPSIFMECKTKAKHSVKTLYDETKKLAFAEGKVPLIILREDGSDEMLWVFERQYIFEIIKELDLHTINSEIPVGTTITKLLDGQQPSVSGELDLYDLQKDLDRQIEEIVMSKTLSKENKALLRGLAILSYYVENLREFLKKEEDDGNDGT